MRQPFPARRNGAPKGEYGCARGAFRGTAMARMDEFRLRFGIPDLELSCPDGRSVNPSTFVGHQLVVLFLPLEEGAAVREIGDYARFAQGFSDNDVWVLNIVKEAKPSLAVRGACHALASDPHDEAWRAFERLADRRRSSPRKGGAVYLFGRGGGLMRAWSGPGHAHDVVRELHRQTGQ